MVPLKRFLLAAALAAAAPAAAQYVPDPLQACADAPGWTPTGHALCAAEAVEAADARIAALLRRARRDIEDLRVQDQAAAQRHWTRYRDLHCGLHDRGGEWRGSQTPANVQSCRLRVTVQREADLRALVEELRPR